MVAHAFHPMIRRRSLSSSTAKTTKRNSVLRKKKKQTKNLVQLMYYFFLYILSLVTLKPYVEEFSSLAIISYSFDDKMRKKAHSKNTN